MDLKIIILVFFSVFFNEALGSCRSDACPVKRWSFKGKQIDGCANPDNDAVGINQSIIYSNYISCCQLFSRYQNGNWCPETEGVDAAGNYKDDGKKVPCSCGNTGFSCH